MMQRHRPSLLTALPLLCALSLAAGYPAAKAQTAQPITSLPKAPGDTNTQTSPPAAQDSSVHPITSLPRPPLPAAQVPDSASATSPEPSAVTQPAPLPIPQLPPATTSSTPSTPPAQPAPVLDAAPLHASIPTPQLPIPAQPKAIAPKRMRPFSTLAAAVNISTSGVGVDLATPLAQHFNLRAGASLFSYNSVFNLDGETIDGALKFRTANASLDWFPFHNGFHISPGLTFYNGNSLNATTLVSPGGEFDLGDQAYYSSLTDPIHGTASLSLGKRYVPRFTIGFGNMIPRSGRHVSFPFEIGFEYIGAPLLSLSLAGSACDTSTPPNCSPVATDPTTQANLLQEENQVNADIRPLRFYPVISQGFAVRF